MCVFMCHCEHVSLCVNVCTHRHMNVLMYVCAHILQYWIRRRMLKISITLHLVPLKPALFPKTRTRLVANKKQQYYLYSSETHILGVIYISGHIWLFICLLESELRSSCF